MDFKQLEAYVQVVRQGSFSKAAEKLYLTQPTISAHISALERESNCQLILRTSKEALPTKLGQDLYNYAVQMLDLRDQALSQLRGQVDKPRGIITLAASSIPYQYVLPKVMVAFREAYPEVSFHVLSFDSAGVAEAISYNRAQIGLAGTLLSDSQCSYEPFLVDELVIATPNMEPYHSIEKTGFTIKELIKLPFIIREPGSGTRKETELFLIEQGVHIEDLNIIAQMDDADAIKRAISQGLGISVLSRLAVVDYAQLGLLRIQRPADGPIQRKLYVVTRKRGAFSPAANAFLDFLGNFFRKSKTQ